MAPQSGSDPLIGTSIGQYEILEKLGGGGMGVVYRARDTRLGRQVALKCLPPQWSHDEQAKQRFVREAQAASATDHRNVCTIHDIASAPDGRLFIVMAFYEGPTLKQRLDGGALPMDEALEIATQVAEGLARAHASGVVHRDIKPGNLILTEDAVKIVDFGLAKFADSLQLTAAGSTVGTLAYMSPEQTRGEDAAPPSDVWAVGVILYEMLAGHPPFRGGYAEAVSHAIRHDTPASLRSSRPEVPEAVEQIVFRALHKNASVRYASARELARALRHARGQTLPQDLRTQPVPVARAPGPDPSSRLPSMRVWRALAATVAVLVLVGTWLLFRSPERPLVVVAPVLNQTGDAQLEPYRLALTHALVRELAGSPRIRVVPYPKMLQTLRRFASGGIDVGSREAIEALASAEAASIVVVPTLLYENQAWRGRVELRNAATAMNVVAYETGSVVSSLNKETSRALVGEVAALVENHFGRGVSGFFQSGASPSPLSSLEAEKSFEEGVSWYEEQEYATAYRAFTAAADRDARDPLPRAWVSRAALVMRLDDEAEEAADRAVRLLTSRTPPVDRLFVEATAAEARGGFDQAEARYRALVERAPDDITWRLELAAFHDRRADSREGWALAVADYHEALAVDPAVIRPHLELCRLYNRLQEPANARRHGQTALSAYRAAGWRGGEALAHFCSADTLRSGTAAERSEARAHAEAALDILQPGQFPYNRSRALYYMGMAAAGESRFSEAAAFWEQADASAREGGNRVLQPLLLMNLGVTHERLGNVPRATDYYGRSAALYERLGDQRRAAQQQASSGALRIAYGFDLDRAFSDVQNALAVLQKLGDAEFEVTCRTALGAFHRYAGRFDEAARELSLGLARARERNLDQRISVVTLALARVGFDRADYGTARALLLGVVGDEGRSGTQALTLLGRVHTRLGDFDAARANLVSAEAEIGKRQDAQLRPALDVAMGELAYESGRPGDARMHFARAAASENTADDVVVWARVYLGLLDGIERRSVSSSTALEASIAQARRMGRVALETTARLFLARAHVLNGRPTDAVLVLRDLPGAAPQNLGADLRAFIHYWRGRALRAASPSAGAAEMEDARKLIAQMRGSIPEAYRDRFGLRPDIRLVTE